MMAASIEVKPYKIIMVRSLKLHKSWAGTEHHAKPWISFAQFSPSLFNTVIQSHHHLVPSQHFLNKQHHLRHLKMPPKPIRVQRQPAIPPSSQKSSNYFTAAYRELTSPDNASVVRSVLMFGVSASLFFCHPVVIIMREVGGCKIYQGVSGLDIIEDAGCDSRTIHRGLLHWN